MSGILVQIPTLQDFFRWLTEVFFPWLFKAAGLFWLFQDYFWWAVLILLVVTLIVGLFVSAAFIWLRNRGYLRGLMLGFVGFVYGVLVASIILGYRVYLYGDDVTLATIVVGFIICAAAVALASRK